MDMVSAQVAKAVCTDAQLYAKQFLYVCASEHSDAKCHCIVAPQEFRESMRKLPPGLEGPMNQDQWQMKKDHALSMFLSAYQVPYGLVMRRRSALNPDAFHVVEGTTSVESDYQTSFDWDVPAEPSK